MSSVKISNEVFLIVLTHFIALRRGKVICWDRCWWYGSSCTLREVSYDVCNVYSLISSFSLFTFFVND